LGAGELGRGDNLHRLCDFFNVADRLETAFDFTESGIVGRVGDDRDGGGSVGGEKNVVS